jgi:hypothetical protein
MTNKNEENTELCRIIRPDENDEWPYTAYKLNEYGLVDNASALNPTKSMLNLARFLFFNANDGAFEDIEEAANEVHNIMCGEFYISNTDHDNTKTIQ